MRELRPFFARDVKYRGGRWFHGWRADHWAEEELIRQCAKPGRMCLEIGADKGRLREEIESCGCRWIGLDIRYSPALSLVADGHVLPFEDNSFDIVLLMCVIEHFKRPRQALLDIHRVLKSGAMIAGVVGFIEPFHDSYYHLSHWGIEQLLRDSGFTPVTIQAGWNGPSLLGKFLLSHGRPMPLALQPVSILIQRMIQIGWLTRWSCRRLAGLTPGRGAAWRRRRLAELEREDPLSWAGHIWFSAVKSGSPRVRLIIEKQ